MKNKKRIIIIALIVCITLFFCKKIYDRHKNKIEHIITVSTSNMKYAYGSHSAILLKDGNVLIIGAGSNYAEIYNTDKKSFKILKLESFQYPTAMNLLANGHVVIFGKGIIDYNPNTNLFKIKNNTFFRYRPKTALFDNEKIFIAGGINPDTHKSINNYKIYNPSNNTLTTVGDINAPYNDNIDVTLLSNGNILIIGNNFSQLYDTKSNKVSNRNTINIQNSWHKIFRLKNNRILIFFQSKKDKKYYVGYYDNIRGTVAQISKLNLNISLSSFILLPDDNVLLTGVALDKDIDYSCKGIYLFKTENNNFQYIGNMKFDRRHPQSTLLKDNKTVLITGGLSSKGNFDFRTNSAELLILK